MMSDASTLSVEEVAEIVQTDLDRREVRDFEHYFSDVLIVLQKAPKPTGALEKKSKKGGDNFIPGIAFLKKESWSLLFNFDDNMTQVLSGFTIDMRVYYNLLRKIIVVKLNQDRIWTRQFYSEDLKMIYLVMKPLDSVIENRAVVGGCHPGRRLPEGDRVGLHRPAFAGGSR